MARPVKILSARRRRLSSAETSSAIPNASPHSTSASGPFGHHREGDEDVPAPLKMWAVFERRNRHERRAAEQERREHGIEDGVAREREDRRACREHERGDQSDLEGDQRGAEPGRHGDERQRPERRGQAGPEFGGADQRHRAGLEPVEEHRLVEEGLLVVVRRQPVAGPQHLARRFGVVGLVGIPERRRAEPPEEDDEQQRRDGAHARRSRARDMAVSRDEGTQIQGQL